MLNRFICVGTLIECSIAVYQTHMRWRFSMDVNNQTIQFTHTVSRRWASKQHAAMSTMIPRLHPRIDGTVLKNGTDRVYTMSANCDNTQFTRLMVTGNINTWRDNVYYNAQYVGFSANNIDIISIEVEGQWIDNSRFLNICADSPRIFSLPKRGQGLCRLKLEHDTGATVRGDTVITHDNGLIVRQCQELGSAISKEEIDKAMLEWSIMSE